MTPPAQPAARDRALNRLRRAIPTPRTALIGALLWAVTMGASALLTLSLGDWETPAKILIVTMLFAAGGALGFPLPPVVG
ncbi:hypothetical protein EN948_34215, partial [Mesorhizobium sp. M7A.F.Ca.US.003.02.1.1]